MNYLKRWQQVICNLQFYPRMAVYNDVEDGKTCNFGELEVYIAFLVILM
jgi:hypothetical protein